MTTLRMLLTERDNLERLMEQKRKRLKEVFTQQAVETEERDQDGRRVTKYVFDEVAANEDRKEFDDLLADLENLTRVHASVASTVAHYNTTVLTSKGCNLLTALATVASLSRQLEAIQGLRTYASSYRTRNSHRTLLDVRGVDGMTAALQVKIREYNEAISAANNIPIDA